MCGLDKISTALYLFPVQKNENNKSGEKIPVVFVKHETEQGSIHSRGLLCVNTGDPSYSIFPKSSLSQASTSNN